jgi:hypothetical protein
MMPSASAQLPNRRHRYPPPDLGVFAEVNPRSAYWLGFLIADGCVTQREVILVLHRRDESHLRAFMRFVGCESRPLRVVNDGQGLRGLACSAALARQLSAFGLRAGQKPIAEVGPSLASSADFWRGVIDGDGTLKCPSGRAPQLALVGFPKLLFQFSKYLADVFADGYVPRPYAHSQSRAVQLVSVSGRHAKQAAGTLYYEGAEFALERKWRRAQQIATWEPQVRHAYPWSDWLDGNTRTLRLGVDYDSTRRLWEAGRRAAKTAGVRLILADADETVTVRAVKGSGTVWQRADTQIQAASRTC